MPVCGHLEHNATVGEYLRRRYKIRGRGDAGQVLLDDALALEAAGSAAGAGVRAG